MSVWVLTWSHVAVACLKPWQGVTLNLFSTLKLLLLDIYHYSVMYIHNDFIKCAVCNLMS